MLPLCMGDPPHIFIQQMANPHVCPHLWFYPEDSEKVVNEYWQAKHWHKEMDAERLTPMAKIRDQHFFTFKPCLLNDSSVCMPVQWFHCAGILFAQAWTLCQVPSAGGGSWVVEEYNKIEVLHVRTGSPPNPNSGCPEIQPNTTNSGGPNNRYAKV